MFEFQRCEAAVISGTRRVVKRRVSFSERNNINVARKRQKLAKTPNTTAIPGVVRKAALAPQCPQRFRVQIESPDTLNLQQIAAARTHIQPLVEMKLASAIDVDAALHKHEG